MRSARDHVYMTGVSPSINGTVAEPPVRGRRRAPDRLAGPAWFPRRDPVGGGLGPDAIDNLSLTWQSQDGPTCSLVGLHAKTRRMHVVHAQPPNCKS